MPRTTQNEIDYLKSNGWEQTEPVAEKPNHFEWHHKELDIFAYFEAAMRLQKKLDTINLPI